MEKKPNYQNLKKRAVLFMKNGNVAAYLKTLVQINELKSAQVVA